MSGPISGDPNRLHLADNVKAIRGILRRRWLMLALVTGALFALAATFIMLMTPEYQASASIQLDPARDPSAGISGSNAPDLGSEYVETEVTVLNSQELARAVVEDLDLASDPEFTEGLPPANTPRAADNRLNRVARVVKNQLSVGRDRLTYVINVGFSSEDPDKAADIANAFAEEYIRSKIGSRIGTAESQSEFFDQQLAELAQDVQAAESALAGYRAQAGIASGTAAGTIVDQQIGPLSAQLATAESEAAEARAQLAAARSQISRGGLDSVSAVRSSPVISDLRSQRAEVLRNQGEILARYGPRHPESIKVANQLQELDQQIRDEANRAVSALEAASRAAEARVSSLRGSLSRLEGQQANNTRASVTAERLEREAETKRAAYERLAQLSMESGQAQRSEIAPATIIDRAVPPNVPSSPRRSILLVLAAIVALAAGMATIITQELLVPGVRNVGEFESQVGLPVLAAVPRVSGNTPPASIVRDEPTSLYGESLRIARASVLGLRTEAPIKTIAFTSALPAEGKTNTALAFARTLAIGGSRTLLIDTDLRRASVKDISAIEGSAGLVEALADPGRLDDAIVVDAVANLDLLPIAKPHYSAEDMFGGGRMAQLLDGLKGAYDHIVLDLPPVLGLADSRFLASLADAVVLVVQWGQTPMKAASSAVSQLDAAEAPVVGAIFSMVDPSSEAIGGLYYSQRYASYYKAR